MRRSALPGLVLSIAAVGALAACSGGKDQGQSTTPATSPSQQPSSSAPSGPPPVPSPASEAKCPYLDQGTAQETNGQHVSKVMVSTDKPQPACFFYRSASEVQLAVEVYSG